MLKLSDRPLSPYAQKAEIALREKCVDFTTATPADLGSGRTVIEFTRANSRAEVPTLLHDGTAIFDSTVIVEYLEDTRPTTTLRPTGGGLTVVRAGLEGNNIRFTSAFEEGQ